MKRKKNILFSMLLIGFSVIAMKRPGGVLIPTTPLKRYYTSKVFLSHAIKKAHFADFKEAVTSGVADVNINTKFDKDPLFFFIFKEIDNLRKKTLGMIETNSHNSQQLIEENSKAITELHKCIDFIVNDSSFNAKCVDCVGETTLHFMIRRRFDSMYCGKSEKIFPYPDEKLIFRRLLKAGAAVNAFYQKLTPLHSLVLKSEEAINVLSSENRLKMAELLIEYGANVNAVGKEKSRPLHFCCDDIRMILLLLANDAHPDKKDKYGEMPMECSENALALDIFSNKDDVVSIIKNKVREKALNNLLAGAKYTNVRSFLGVREVQYIPIKEFSSYPYTEAIMEYTKDMKIEDILKNMGYIGDDIDEFGD